MSASILAEPAPAPIPPSSIILKMLGFLGAVKLQAAIATLVLFLRAMAEVAAVFLLRPAFNLLQEMVGGAEPGQATFDIKKTDLADAP